MQEGFLFHHAEPNYLMLVYWIPGGANTLPANASHRVGVGAFVMNGKREVYYWILALRILTFSLLWSSYARIMIVSFIFVVLGFSSPFIWSNFSAIQGDSTFHSLTCFNRSDSLLAAARRHMPLGLNAVPFLCNLIMFGFTSPLSCFSQLCFPRCCEFHLSQWYSLVINVA